MKTTSSLLWRAAFLAFAFVLSSGSAAAAPAAPKSELGELVGTVVIPAGTAQAQVRAAIVAALTSRQWTVKSQSGDRVVGHLKHRTNEATVTFVIGDAKVDQFCVGWQIDKKTGAHEKPELPTRWLTYLREDLAKAFTGAVVRK